DIDVDYVGAENREGGYAAAEHLYSHGCRKISFVGGYLDASAREERAGGVSVFLTDHDLALPQELSATCEPLRPPAREVAIRLLTDHPEVDGIVCFSDVVAFGVLDAVADLGLRVGSDVRVIGFDDVHDAGLNRPSLSSVAVPARETGRRAAQLVLERAAGSTEPTVREEFPTKLEPRETCGCPRPHPLP
ncbi:MAG TPA: substrate-binding domain-containing protein, partial [Propionibacteriaceae bacterium]|nr:substrate-binding domain-containing protein [Propionibacteriaceae bacterium]